MLALFIAKYVICIPMVIEICYLYSHGYVYALHVLVVVTLVLGKHDNYVSMSFSVWIDMY